jgi:hypothetical protein
VGRGRVALGVEVAAGGCYSSDFALTASIVRPVAATPMQVGQAPQQDAVISRYLPRNGMSLMSHSRNIGAKSRGKIDEGGKPPMQTRAL